MASTYTLISSQVLASSAASVTFSSIPATYTDLVLRYSARNDAASIATNLLVSYNGSSSSFSSTLLYGDGASAASTRLTNNTNAAISVSASATTNTFANGEFYVPNYSSANYKSYSSNSVSENNATTAYVWISAGLWSNTAAITSMTLSLSGSNFVQYSSFYLYGISNA